MGPVLLIFAGNRENMPSIPFSVVVLASYLRKNKIPVEILDTRINSYTDINYDKYKLIGISAKTGEQVCSAVKICQHIKNKSKTPIVWGGPHATFFPEQTCSSKLADFVVRGEGEIALLELYKALDDKKFENIKGLVFKKDGKVVSNPDRDFLDMKELDLPAYDMIDLDKYQDKIQSFTVEFSRGCPHRCSFCYVHDFHKQKWRKKSIDQFVKEVEKAHKEFGVNKFFICDDNFFVAKKYVLEFSKKIIEKKLNEKIEIFASARANYFSNYTDEEVKLIRNAGFNYIAIGAESGSQRVLDFIKKDITCTDIIKSAKNCISHDITPVYSFIIGTPGEKRYDLHKTIDMFLKLKKISPKIEINGFYIYTPYPGTPIFKEAVKRGYKPCASLEEWSKWKFSDLSNLTWLDKKYKKELQVLSKIILFWFLRDRLESYGSKYKKEKIGSGLTKLIWDVGSFFMHYDAKFRLKHKFLSFGYEWILFGLLALKLRKLT